MSKLIKKNMTCIICPMGCSLDITFDEETNSVVKVTDNGCPRGPKYAEKELINPTRTLTSTIKVENGTLAVVPVKSAGELPRDSLLQYMEVIRRTEVSAPVRLGDVLIRDILGSGVNIVACADVEKE